MNSSQERLTRALETYAAALGELAPSPQLEARMQIAMQRELAVQPKRTRVRRWAWGLAASILLAVSTSVVMQVMQLRTAAESRNASLVRAPTQNDMGNTAPGAAPDAAMVFPGGAVSLWPTQGTVFRVRSTLNNAGIEPRGFERQWAEQQYWIDVRVANDGSMRIERVLSTDGTELFARQRIEP